MFSLLIVHFALIALATANRASMCTALYQLDDLAYCRLGVSYAAYMHYGCACSGIDYDAPVDALDKCCSSHQLCYNELVARHECAYPTATTYCFYHFTCTSHKQIVCHNNNACAQAVCACDAALINCLADYAYPAFPRNCSLSPLHGHKNATTRAARLE